MRRVFKILLLMSLAMAVLALIGGTLVWQELIAQPDIGISINGEDMGVQSFGAVPWFGAVLGMFIAGLVICVVLPLALLLWLLLRRRPKPAAKANMAA